MKRVLLTGLFGLIAAVFGAGAIFTIHAHVTRPAPWDPAPFLEIARQYDVEIRRDNWGVPHIYGPRDADVAYGLGYAHAEDDFATIQEVAIATRGKLGAVKGPDAAVTDYIVHLLQVWETVEAQYETALSEETRAVLEAYAHGINLFAALHPEKVEPGLAPMTGKDIAAGFVFKTPFFYGLDKQLMELFEPERKRSISKNPETAFLPVDEPVYPTGSNGFAIAPSRSDDGHTRLLVNSHQPYKGPVAWYEVRLKSEEGWDVAGGAFPGSPFMLHGHNRYLGWANTVNKPDLADVYVLTLNPENENQYLLDGEWKELERKEAEIKVKLFGPFYWTVTRDVFFSEHGPVLKTDHGAYAIRYAGMNELRQAEQYFRLNKARNFEEWIEAMKMQALPSINYVYGDKDGNIAYIYNAQFPDRAEGWDWQAYLPGDRSDLIWQNYLPFEEVPKLINPKSGYVFNANNTPFRATAAADNLSPAQFPAFMGIETGMTNRAFRAEELLSRDEAISAEEFAAYKYDLYYSPASKVGLTRAAILTMDLSDDEDLVAAQKHLADWNLGTDQENRHAALGVLTLQPLIMAELRGTEAPPLRQALADAVDVLMDNFGRLDPPWGELNRLRRGKVDLPLDGGPDILRAVYGGEPNDDGTLTARAGDTYIMFVEWDEDGALNSQSIHQFGSATLDEASPHFADQAPLFADMEMKPVLFEEEVLEPHIAARYRPGLLPEPEAPSAPNGN